MVAKTIQSVLHQCMPTGFLYRLTHLVILVVTVIIVGCGGGTRGSGGQLYDGFIGDESKRALTNVSVTILGTGDSAVSDQEGKFTIRTESLAGPLTILIERSDLSTTVQTESIPADATVIQLIITVGAGAKPTASASIEVRERKSPTPPPSNTPDDSNGSDNDNEDSSSDDDNHDDDDTESDDDDSSDDSGSGGVGPDDSGGSGGGDSNGDDSSSNDPRDGEKRDVEGSISAIDTTQVTVLGTVFSVTSSSEFRDSKGKEVTLSSFSLGISVRARGEYQGGRLLLTRLEMR